MLVVAALMSVRASAHPALGTVVEADVTEEDGVAEVEIIVIHDALAFALNDTSARITDPQMYELLDSPPEVSSRAFQDGYERFTSGFKIMADGEPLPLEMIDYPTSDHLSEWIEENGPNKLPVKMEFIAKVTLPPNAQKLSFKAPMVFDQVFFVLEMPGLEATYFPLQPAETSPEFDVSYITTAHTHDPDALDGEGDGEDGSAGHSHHHGASAKPPRQGIGAVGIAWHYLVLGYRHIIPVGYDHELFILGLFLLCPTLKDLLFQTTAFTVAHTCTLTLATLGWVHISSGIVEPLIAISIAVIAVENLVTKKSHPWRPAIAFFFGLIHGLGFASGLADIGLPPVQLASGLAAFSVGVELGHLTILALAFLLLGWFRKKDWYRPWVTIPLSVVIAGIAMFWFVQRII